MSWTVLLAQTYVPRSYEHVTARDDMYRIDVPFPSPNPSGACLAHVSPGSDRIRIICQSRDSPAVFPAPTLIHELGRRDNIQQRSRMPSPRQLGSIGEFAIGLLVTLFIVGISFAFVTSLWFSNCSITSSVPSTRVVWWR